MYARPFIDSLDFARNGRAMNGEVSVTELPRLLDVLENRHGTLAYSLQGGIDAQGMPYLDMVIGGQCQLRCQRCLESMDYPVQIDTRLLLHEQAVDVLDHDGANDDGFDGIPADPQLDVLNMLEEEILLGLPFAPKHDAGICQIAGIDNVRKDAGSPFAVLAGLKHN